MLPFPCMKNSLLIRATGVDMHAGFFKHSVLCLFIVAKVLSGVHAQSANAMSSLENGKALFATGRFSESKVFFDRAARDLLTMEEAGYWQILSRIALGEGASTLETIENYRKMYPEGRFLPDLLYQRGRLQYQTGEYLAAYESFKWFIELRLIDHPLRSSAIFWLGECLVAMGWYDQAKTVYTSLLRDYPDSIKRNEAQERLTWLATPAASRAPLGNAAKSSATSVTGGSPGIASASQSPPASMDVSVLLSLKTLALSHIQLGVQKMATGGVR